jgi:hypothetical protein
MDYRFIHQRTPERITTLDVIELYNCGDSGYSAGEYTVGDVEPETGEVTLFGMGPVSGCVAAVFFGEPA